MSERRASLPPQLENMLLAYTMHALVENPDDLVSHAADYFTRLRDGGQPWTTEDGEVIDQVTVDIRSILGERADKRPPVIAEPVNPAAIEDDADQLLDVIPKTPEEKELIMGRLRKEFLFQDWDDKDLEVIVDAMIPKEVEEGQIIIRQGDDGDFFYVIDSGVFEAFMDENGKEQTLKQYDGSGSFGELALLHQQKRAATVRALTDGKLYAVSRQAFRRFVLKRSFEKRERYTTLIEEVPELSELSKEEKMKVVDSLEPVSIKEDEILFEQGDEPDGMYFIDEGSVYVVKEPGDEIVAHLKRGEYFGELALVNPQPRTATIVAAEDSKVAFLDKAGFERLLGPVIEIMKRRLEKYNTPK